MPTKQPDAPIGTVRLDVKQSVEDLLGVSTDPNDPAAGYLQRAVVALDFGHLTTHLEPDRDGAQTLALMSIATSLHTIAAHLTSVSTDRRTTGRRRTKTDTGIPVIEPVTGRQGRRSA